MCVRARPDYKRQGFMAASAVGRLIFAMQHATLARRRLQWCMCVCVQCVVGMYVCVVIRCSTALRKEQIKNCVWAHELRGGVQSENARFAQRATHRASDQHSDLKFYFLDERDTAFFFCYALERMRV